MPTATCGRKHSLGDFFVGGLTGCAAGALMTIDGAGEALDSVEGGDLSLTGADGGEDTGGLGDDGSGDGGGEDGGGENSCTVSRNSVAADTSTAAALGGLTCGAVLAGIKGQPPVDSCVCDHN